MASDSDKQGISLTKKLLVGQDVEVLSGGSWQCGVVTYMQPHLRFVKYNHLFKEDNPQAPNITETVPVSPAIDGIPSEPSFRQLLNFPLDELSPNNSSPHNFKRNNIRPWPCRLPLQPSEATYGMCVDVHFRNAHYEGVILDDTNEHTAQIIQRIVFFPDLDTPDLDAIQSVSLKNLSLTSDWDEVTGKWTLRGRWKFLEALEANNLESASLCMTVKQLWHIAKLNPYFVSKIGEWTCGACDEWFSLVGLIHQLAQSINNTTVQSRTSVESVSDFVEVHRNRSNSQVGISSKILKEKSELARSHLVSEGWQFMETKGGRKYYVSAEGTRYDSFIKACEGYLSGKAGPLPQETATYALVTGCKIKNKATEEPDRRRHAWEPVNLIPVISSVLVQSAKYRDVTSDTVRKHLLHLGWIVEYRRDINRPMTRYRYRSPEGQTYYSLRMVFADFVNGLDSTKDRRMQLTQNESKPDVLMFSRDYQSVPRGHHPSLAIPLENGENPVLAESLLIKSLLTENLPESLPEQLKEQIDHVQINQSNLEDTILTEENWSSPNGDCSYLPMSTGNEGSQLGLNEDLFANDVQPEYLAQSIKKYVKCIDDRTKSNLKGYISPYDVRSNAKRQLFLAGWTHHMIHGKRKTSRLLYRSPSGKCFGSLLQACKAYLTEASTASGDATIMEERNIAGETSGSCTSILTKCESNVGKRKHHTVYTQGTVESHQGRPKKRKRRDLANLIKARSKHIKSKENTNFYCEVKSNSPTSPGTLAKTTLSLLVNKNLVMPRTRVSYRYRQFTQDGVITCNGIRCNCCSSILSATDFELHARGDRSARPLQNIYLRDGRSLLQCLVEAMETSKLDMRLAVDHNSDSDEICSACHQDGFLVECCNCPAAFHPSCVKLKEIPECYWCPLCCCRTCGLGVYNSNSNVFYDKATTVCCEQCEGRFHIGCITEDCQNLGSLTEPWFCSSQCSMVTRMLDSIIGQKNSTSAKDLTWRILKYSRWAQDQTADLEPALRAEQLAKICLASEVLDECFMPMIEPRTNRDIISDVIFNRESNLSRLNFKGFYTIILEKDDEVVAVATLRIHGKKIAELPLVCTRERYRRQGMCRHLITEIEKLLWRLKVERIALPSIPEHLSTWHGAFNFNIIEEKDLLDLVKHNILTFRGSTLCEKKVCHI